MELQIVIYGRQWQRQQRGFCAEKGNFLSSLAVRAPSVREKVLQLCNVYICGYLINTPLTRSNWRFEYFKYFNLFAVPSFLDD